MGIRQVFYESWQMECCGTPFSVGEEVSWPVMPMSAGDLRDWGWDGESYDGLGRVERHGGEWPEITGRVRAIHLVHQEYAETGPGSRSFEPVPGARSLEAVRSCPRWFEHTEPTEPAGSRPRRSRRADGVLVALDVPGAAPSQPRDRP